MKWRVGPAYNHIMAVRVFLAVLLVCPLFAQSQPPAAQEPKPIRVQVNEVIIPVTVTDDKGRFVSDLDKVDFQIFDEGKPQSIRYFSRERSQPVVVGFLRSEERRVG